MALAHKFDIIKYLNPKEYCKLTNQDNWQFTHHGECDLSSIGMVEVLKKLNMKQKKFTPDLDTSSIEEIDTVIKGINNKNFNTLRVSTGLHQFFIEVNGKSIRILSLYGDRHGFYDYSKYSKFGKYFEIDGDTYNEMIGYFNDIIKFKPRDEGHMPLRGDVKPIFKNPKEGKSKMNKAINARIALFGVRHDGVQAEAEDPRTTMNRWFTYLKNANPKWLPNVAAAEALRTLKSGDIKLLQRPPDIYYTELSLYLVKYYTTLLHNEGVDLGYQKNEMDSEIYHQLRIRNHKEYTLPRSEEYEDDLKVSAGGRSEGYIKVKVHKLN
jgi:hypothetical protein